MKLPALSCLQAGAERLALALVLALLVVPGYVVAPVLFAHAGSSHLAGMLAGQVFHVGNVAILLLLMAVAGFWWRMGSRRIAWLLLLSVAVLVGINEFGITPVINHLKATLGPIDALPHGDPGRARFGMWHGISELLYMLAGFMAALLVARGDTNRAREGGGCNR